MEASILLEVEDAKAVCPKQQLREALSGDFYCPWIWSGEKTMNCYSLENQRGEKSSLVMTGQENAFLKDPVPPNEDSSLESIKQDAIEGGSLKDEEEQGGEIEDLPSLKDFSDKIHTAFLADIDSSNPLESNEKQSCSIQQTGDDGGEAGTSAVSTNTSQPVLIDAITGSSQPMELIDCSTGSSQPLMLECGIQTSQGLLEDFMIATKAPIVFPRLALQTTAPQVPPKRPRLDFSDDYEMGHPIYSNHRTSGAMAYEFDDDTDKENTWQDDLGAYGKHTDSSVKLTSSCPLTASMEKESSSDPSAERCLPPPSSSPLIRNVVRIGLSKKYLSANRHRSPLNPIHKRK